MTHPTLPPIPPQDAWHPITEPQFQTWAKSRVWHDLCKAGDVIAKLFLIAAATFVAALFWGHL